jgi:hypothetical protein
MASQGVANVDCVTVWFLGMKTNWMVSPTAAVTCGGLYARGPPPTMTWVCTADATVARVARAAEVSAKRILGRLCVFWCNFQRGKTMETGKAGL